MSANGRAHHLCAVDAGLLALSEGLARLPPGALVNRSFHRFRPADRDPARISTMVYSVVKVKQLPGGQDNLREALPAV